MGYTNPARCPYWHRPTMEHYHKTVLLLTMTIDEIKEKYEEYTNALELLETAIEAVEEASLACPENVAFSHHAEMELNDTKNQLEFFIRTIDDALEQI